ncbi:MAG TPA: hypothetical protein VIK05_10335 [Ilumatobacteraceae bacterium]
MSPRTRAFVRWAPGAFLVVVLGRLCWLAWTAAPRGVDFSDEGIYLVSYRYYRSPEMVYNGAPAVFGPLFDLVGQSVSSLRRIKLVLVLASGVGLGWATAAFMARRLSRTLRLDAIAIRVTVSLFVAVGAFTMYTWLPQSPGYNDLSVMCAMALAAVTLPVLGTASIKSKWWLAAAGAVISVALINKWPAGLCMIIVFIVALALADGWRECGRGLAMAAGGLVVGLALVAILGGSFFDRVSELRSSSEQISDTTPVWNSYLVPYWRNLAEVSRAVGGRAWLLLAIGVGLALVAALRRSMALGAVLAIGLLLVMRAAYDAGVFRGGSHNVAASQVALPLLLILAGTVWLVSGVAAQPASRDADSTAEPRRILGAALVLLIGLAGAHAFGTLNPVMFVVVSSGALCASAIAVIGHESATLWRPAIIPVGALFIVVPIATERMMLSGLWQHPYQLTTNLYAQTTSLDGVIGYEGLRTDPDTATLLRNLSSIARTNDLVGRAGFSVSTTPGYTMALGLRQPPADLFVGPPEQFPFNAEVYEARLRTACSRGLIDPDDPPVILTDGPSAPDGVSRILADCGINFPADFALEVASSPTSSIGVWVPVTEAPP